MIAIASLTPTTATGTSESTVVPSPSCPAHGKQAAQVELGGPGGATNPEELFAAAHANCFTSTITSMARSRGIELAHVVTEARVRLEWSDDAGDHRLAASDLAVRLSSPAAESELRALVDDATEHCPVCQAIRGNVAMQVTAQFDAV